MQGIASQRNLEFIISRNLEDPGTLPKTMVFMDEGVAVCDTTTQLINLLRVQFKSVNLICDYSTAFSEKRQGNIIAKFMAGRCRILICTEAAGMGVDVSDVK